MFSRSLPFAQKRPPSCNYPSLHGSLHSPLHIPENMPPSPRTSRRRKRDRFLDCLRNFIRWCNPSPEGLPVAQADPVSLFTVGVQDDERPPEVKRAQPQIELERPSSLLPPPQELSSSHSDTNAASMAERTRLAIHVEDHSNNRYGHTSQYPAQFFLGHTVRSKDAF